MKGIWENVSLVYVTIGYFSAYVGHNTAEGADTV